MATKNETKNEEATAAANNGGGAVISADAFRAIEREEKLVSLPGGQGSVRIRGLSTAQTDAINAELGEGSSEFRMIAAIAHAGIVEPDDLSLDDLLEKSPTIVALIGTEVAALSGMNESAVSAVEKSVREG